MTHINDWRNTYMLYIILKFRSSIIESETYKGDVHLLLLLLSLSSNEYY